MAGLTTHVLDTSIGRPASGVEIELHALGRGRRARVGQADQNQRRRAHRRAPSRRRRGAGRNLRIVVPCRRLFPRPRRSDGRTAVPRHRADPLRHRRPERTLPRAAGGDAMELFHLPRQLNSQRSAGSQISRKIGLAQIAPASLIAYYKLAYHKRALNWLWRTIGARSERRRRAPPSRRAGSSNPYVNCRPRAAPSSACS